MVFSSITFLFYFLPAVLLLVGVANLLLRPLLSKYALTNVTNTILLVCSLIFYYWGEGSKIWVLITSIVATFATGLLIDFGWQNKSPATRKIGLAIGVSVNVGLLIWFKYLGFGAELLTKVGRSLGLETSVVIDTIVLPLGISFFVFQSLSYLFDVYRMQLRATRKFVAYSCYITFFPQLIAGPIVRYYDIKDEIIGRNISLDSLTEGFSRFIIGLSKKVLIANRVGELSDDLFATAPQDLSTFGCWLAAIAYATQILFDFSGYSDMAIGLAKIFGISIPENFNAPYKAHSMRQFWSRWHISLSSWFRDYLYIPMGGSRTSAIRTCINLATVFLVCGLWHGASMNFVLWGAFHGIFLTLEHFLIRRKFKYILSLPTAFGQIYTLIVVFSSWVLFRAETTEEAKAFFHFMFFDLNGIGDANLPVSFYSLEIQAALVIGLFISTVPLSLPRSWNGSKNTITIIAEKSALLALLLLSIAYISISSHNPFIYFRF